MGGFRGRNILLETLGGHTEFSIKPTLSLEEKKVAISRTQSKTLVPLRDSVREIRNLYIDAITSADTVIYMENQYFSSQAVYMSLMDRMRNIGRRPSRSLLPSQRSRRHSSKNSRWGWPRPVNGGENVTRIIVTHHPYDIPGTEDAGNIVGRAQMAMTGFAQCRVDMILSGHLHASYIGNSAARYKIPGHSALVVQSGTATSSRRRGENNSFNLIAINRPYVRIARLTWDGTSFALSESEHFEFAQDGWKAIRRELGD